MNIDPSEAEIYSWQVSVDGFGEAGQRKLKEASVMISRCGGLGSLVAYELAAAGVGRLVIAHAGDIKPSDLNRQLLMTHDALGTPRIDSVVKRLKELNPRVEVVGWNQNVSAHNVAALVGEADLVVDCAPLFEERFLMNDEAVRQGKPLVECAMYEMQAQITSVLPGKSACLRCLYPEFPSAWKRRFPVFGAVSGSLGCIAAMEAIKILSGMGTPLYNCLLSYDLRQMSFRKFELRRREDCASCGIN